VLQVLHTWGFVWWVQRVLVMVLGDFFSPPKAMAQTPASEVAKVLLDDDRLK